MSNTPTLSEQERADLRRLAGFMIPPSEEFRVPGAGDPAIQADINATLGRDLPDVRAALGRLRELAGESFADLDPARAETIAESFQAETTAPVTTLGRVVLQCYYRDDRVMISLGLEPRPPFPKGNVLEPGDWSLLDAVRKRPKFWREAPRSAS